MRIRDLQWRGVSTWPPEFAISDQLVGEEWILESVQLRDNSKIKLISVTTANHQAGEKKGIIILEDPIHLQFLYNKLKENIGKITKRNRRHGDKFLLTFREKDLKAGLKRF